MIEPYAYDFSQSGVSPEALARELAGAGEAIRMIRDEIATGDYATPAAFASLPADGELFSQSQAAVERLGGEEITHVLVIGIGGSSLGARALAEALAAKNLSGKAKLFFIETVSARGIEDITVELLRDVVAPENLAIFIISKSGTTTETIAAAAVIVERLEHRFGDISRRIVAISDEDSPLAELSRTKNYILLAVPKTVGGRYSVFSPVGVAPLLAAGFPMREVLAGAQSVTKVFLSASESTPHSSVIEAAIIAAQVRGGMHTHNLFVFEPSFESLGKWWRQLFAESLGKEYGRNGTSAMRGMLPVVSVGSTDLHSVGQWYLSGAPSVFTTFLSLGSTPRVIVPDNPIGHIASALLGKGLGDILNAIMDGTIRAYRAKNLPLLEVRLREQSAEAIGAWMEHQMLCAVIAGYLLNVDPFDQPNVEEYKRETKRILAGGV
ncbi:MAG: hypothetical protein ACYC8S_02430 [Minisyncoccota bacterium]